MKNRISKGMSLLIGAAFLASSCTDSFLKPDPLSFYEPDVTFSTESGLKAGMAMADKHLRHYWTHYQNRNLSVPIGTEYLFSELSLFSKDDQGNGVYDNFADKLTPTGGISGGDDNQISYFWGETYTGIKYANTVLNYVDGVSGLSEGTKNAYKGRAYFHRAYRYMALVFQFGDVPLVTKLLEVPKENYRSTKKEAILEMITKDLEFAVEWVPEQADMEYYGMVNKGACRQLLIKCYLATGQFEKAEQQADILINQYKLMQEPFGTFTNSGEPDTWNITRNVIWDLHRPVNKTVGANTEAIMVLPNSSDQTHIDFLTMRIFGPFWNDARLKMPDGQQAAMNYARTAKQYNKSLDNLRAFGRGIGVVRLTHFAQHGLWTVNGVEDTQDLRHNSAVGNWVNMEDIKCNNPASEYYGQGLRLYKDDGSMLSNDTLRNWYDFPLYKLYLKDENAEANQGANQFNGATKGSDATWYLYRLAETYLLRAEAKFYQGKDATSDVNEVRKRAKCSQFYTTVNIGDIMNERARELYLEEWRHAELVRVSYCLALSGKPDEWGNTYSLDNWDKQDGTDLNGGSYWYQRLVRYSLYNRHLEGITSGQRTYIYKMDKHNMYWPIPNSAITSNKKGQLHQNYGYDGYDANIPMWDNWEDAVADEGKTE